MHRIALRVIADEVPNAVTGVIEEGGKVYYRAQIINLLRFPQGGGQGIDFVEVGKLMPLLAKVRASADESDLLLEDAEYALVTDRLKAARWSAVSGSLMAFINDVIAAPSI
jgi:hypothetical protein